MREWIVLGVLCTGCATYTSELERGQQAFEKNEHERALAVLRALEPDQTHFDPPEEARYAYLRGMTDYRIGYRADARHWLAIAKAIDDKNPDSSPGLSGSRCTCSPSSLDTPASGEPSRRICSPTGSASRPAPTCLPAIWSASLQPFGWPIAALAADGESPLV